jgi:putative membrane protein
MKIILDALILAVSMEHFFIMILEMFFIKSPVAKKAFDLDSEFLEQKKVNVMFANQGLYNGFLAAGLLWSLLASETISLYLKIFFLSCVIVAAVFGSITANKKIIFTQGGLPIVAMAVLIVSIFA